MRQRTRWMTTAVVLTTAGLVSPALALGGDPGNVGLRPGSPVVTSLLRAAPAAEVEAASAGTPAQPDPHPSAPVAPAERAAAAQAAVGPVGPPAAVDAAPAAPEVSAPEVAASAESSPGMSAPDASGPEVSSPEVSSPEVSDSEWSAQVPVVSATPQPDGSVQLSWSAVPGALAYEVWEAGTVDRPVATVPAPEVTMSSGALTADERYEYQVRAVSPTGAMTSFGSAPVFLACTLGAEPVRSGVRPSRANTGIVAGGVSESSLVPFPAGPNTKDGLVLENRLIVGDLTIYGDNVRMKNTKVTGNLIVRQNTGFVAENIDVGHTHVLWAKNWRINRLYVTGRPGWDAVQISSDGTAAGRNENGILENSYIGNPMLTPGAHWDAIQVMGSKNLTLRGNYLDMGTTLVDGMNVALFLQDMHGGSVDTLVDGNWIRALGHYDIMSSGSNIRFRNNIVQKNTTWAAVAVLFPGAVVTEWTNNRWADGTPIAL